MGICQLYIQHPRKSKNQFQHKTANPFQFILTETHDTTTKNVDLEQQIHFQFGKYGLA
jgi:hypothetical protein